MIVMKKSSLIFLIPLMLIFLMTFVAAAGIIEGILAPITNFLFGVNPVTESWQLVIISIVIFSMFGFAFSDIISITTLFSKTVSYILGFGLAIIASLSGLTSGLAYWLFSITAALGIFSVVASLISAFVVWFLIHWGVGGIEQWLMRRKAYMQVHKKGTDVLSGAELLRQVGKWGQS